MFPSIFPVLSKRNKTRKRSLVKPEKSGCLRETSPDVYQECFGHLEDYIKTKLDIQSSLFTAFASTVRVYHLMFPYNTMHFEYLYCVCTLGFQGF